MKYFLRKTKIEEDIEKDDIVIETEFEKKDLDKQIKDENFDKTQIHICKHREGLPCELIDV